MVGAATAKAVERTHWARPGMKVTITYQIAASAGWPVFAEILEGPKLLQPVAPAMREAIQNIEAAVAYAMAESFGHVEKVEVAQ